MEKEKNIYRKKYNIIIMSFLITEIILNLIKFKGIVSISFIKYFK